MPHILRLYLLIALLIGVLCVGLTYGVDGEDDAPEISLSCRDAPLRSVLAQLAIQKGINLVGLDRIPETLTLTIHLNEVSLEAGISAILEPNAFTLEKRDNIYFILPEPEENQRLTVTIIDQKLTITANTVDVQSVITALADAGVSITAAPNLTGTITAHIKDKSIDNALTVIFSDFAVTESDGIFRIAARAPFQSTGGQSVRIRNGRIELTAINASLTELLAELALRAEINLSVVGTIEKQITVRLENRTLEKALTDLAAMTGYTYRRIDDLHFFGKPEIKPNEINPLIQRKTLWLKHLSAKEVLNLIPTNIPKQNITVSETHNAVTVIGSMKLIEATEQLLTELDIANDAIRGRMNQGSIAITTDSETQRLTVDIVNARLDRVMRELCIQTETDVVFLNEAGTQTESQNAQTPSSRNTSDIVTLRRTNATLGTVLDALFVGTRYTYKWASAVPNEPALLVIGVPAKDTPLATEALIPLSYLDASNVIELHPHATVALTSIPDRNAILATGSPHQIREFSEHLKRIDIPQPQAMIKLYLLELTHGNRDELGLTITASENQKRVNIDDGVGLTFNSLATMPKAFEAKLSALVERNRGKVLANPSLAVVNGKTASIDIGGKYLFETNNPIYPTVAGTSPAAQAQQTPAVGMPYPYSGYAPSIYRSLLTIETGILLELTPRIGAEGDVAMEIQLQIRDADQISREQSSLDQRQIMTTIRVPDSGMVAIGGLLQEKENTKVSKVPILGHIPLIGGWLFTQRETTAEQTELIVIIQPKVITASNAEAQESRGTEEE